MNTAAADARLDPHGHPAWLAADLGRAEKLLFEAAGASTHPLVGEAATHLIAAGGKRLRPALVMTAARAGSPTPATDLAAAAVELIHLASLYHDDVMDETETRRGVPTVHSRWGINVAVLAGDFLFASGCALGAEAGGEVPAILAAALRDLCEGQIREAAAAGDLERGVPDYFETIRRKTGALFAAACELGAVTSSAADAHRHALVDYGHALGAAFQLVDDLLDFVGDPAVTGKLPGTDWREGIYTLPVLIGRDRNSELKEPGASALPFEDVLAILGACGALETARAAAEAHVRRALETLDGLPHHPWRDVLEGMAAGTLARLP